MSCGSLRIHATNHRATELAVCHWFGDPCVDAGGRAATACPRRSAHRKPLRSDRIGATASVRGSAAEGRRRRLGAASALGPRRPIAPARSVYVSIGAVDAFSSSFSETMTSVIRIFPAIEVAFSTGDEWRAIVTDGCGFRFRTGARAAYADWTSRQESPSLPAPCPRLARARRFGGRIGIARGPRG